MREIPANIERTDERADLCGSGRPVPFLLNEEAVTETAGFGRVKVINYDAVRRNPEGTGIERILGVVVKSPLGAEWFSGDLRG